MHSAVIPGAILLALLLGGPAVAQQAKPAPQTEGKALADPDQQRQADDAMNTESGKTGKTEPGSHAPTSDAQVLQGGKLKPGQPTENGRPNPARQ